jgi:choline dehydrogenase-like flavoprotein
VLSDARGVANGSSLDADVCLVGAGAAGITIARQLRESGLQVVLLESGGFEPDEGTQALYRGDNKGHEYFSLDVSRLRYFGGTTNHWNGWCRPLDAIDLEERPEIPGSGWPVRHGELAPWYDVAAELVQLQDFSIDASGREPDSRLPLDSSHVASQLYWYSAPTRFGEVYRRDLVAADNIALYLHANVVDISPSARPTVAVRTLSGRSFRVTSSVLVLCCGGIENARLLLSGRGGRGIGGRSVGRYFMEHPHVPVGTAVVDTEWAQSATYAASEDQATRGALVVADSVVRDRGLLRCSLTLDEFSGEHAKRADEVQSVVMSTDGRATQTVTVYARAEQSPDPDSRVALGRKRDRFGVPRPVLFWRLNDRDLHSIDASVEVVAQALGAAGVGRVRVNPGYRKTITGGQHHMGTTRMGADPATSVVDRDGLVHGTDALYVAGSSVFPTVGFANPTLTICALAARLADHLESTLAS